MKKVLGLVIGGAIGLASCGDTKTEQTIAFEGLNTAGDSLSYFIGTNMGGALKKDNMHPFYAGGAFFKGFEDATKGDSMLLVIAACQPFAQALTQTQKTAAPIADDYKISEDVSFAGINNAKDTISYMYGANLAQGLSRDNLNELFSKQAFLQGFKDQVYGDSLKLSMENAMALANRIVMVKQKEKAEADKVKFQEKIKSQQEFLNEVTRRDGIVTLPSGLRYEVLKAGNGPKPMATDMVETHYHGTLIDGTVFDSSVDRGQPAKFPVNRVIPAWTEALQLMPVGSKWKLYCPYDIAYGAQSPSPAIGPYETLIFEVELLGIGQ